MNHDQIDRDELDRDGLDHSRLQLVLFGAALGPLVLMMVLLVLV